MFLGEQAYFIGLLIAYLAFAGALAFGMITSSKPEPPQQRNRSVDQQSHPPQSYRH